MNESELPVAVRTERLSRFVDRLGAVISDDIKVSIEPECVRIEHQLTSCLNPLHNDEPETYVALSILDEIQVVYADTKFEYWPQLGQARMEYRVVSTADGLELEFRLP